MPFFDGNDRSTGTNNYSVPMGWREAGSIGTMGTTTSLDQVGTNKLRGFVMYFEHEILNGDDQSFGIRLFQNGTAITSYGSAYRENGAVVSSKSTNHIQAATNTTSNSIFDVVSSKVKVWMPTVATDTSAAWAVAEVTNLNENVGFDKYYYKFEVPINEFDYSFYWTWLTNTSTMSVGTSHIYYTAYDTNVPGVF